MGLNENGKVLLEKIQCLKLNPYTVDQIKGFIRGHTNNEVKDGGLEQVLLGFEEHESYKRSVYGTIIKHLNADTLHELTAVPVDSPAAQEPAPPT